MRALSAERPAPLPSTEPKSAVRDRIKEQAADKALNAVAILREAVEDFRNSDRYFKYKAGILALWLLLSGVAFVVACPGAGGAEGNSLGAVLVAEPSRQEFMIRNDSAAPWVNVTVRVNDTFTTTAPSIGAGESLVFTPKQLSGPEGQSAPKDIRVMNIDLTTTEGEVTLMRRGQHRP